MTSAPASRNRVLVTGASGFIGRDLIIRLAAGGWQVRAAARDPAMQPPAPGIETAALGDLTRPYDWRPLLDGITHVVHLAGIAHATSAIPEATYDAVNSTAVASLAEAARSAGLQRVVMMSSIRAQCGASAESVVNAETLPAPVDAYGRAKLAGERHLAAILKGSVTSWCVLRPVLVYGPGVKGNMATLVKLARMPWPLPLGGLTAQRSLLGLVNLEAAVLHALTSDAAAGGTYLLADPEPITVPTIVSTMRTGMGRSPRIFSVPMSPLKAAAGFLGCQSAWQRIAGDLVVSTATLEATGWNPRETAREGIFRWMHE